MNIKGIVNDESGAALFQAAVYESDQVGRLTGKGTATNDKGEFDLTVSPGGFLSVRYLGYQPITTPKTSTYYIFEMQPGAFDLPPVDVRPEPKNYNVLVWLGLGLLLSLLNDKKK
jgi:hypothetical protein